MHWPILESNMKYANLICRRVTGNKYRQGINRLVCAAFEEVVENCGGEAAEVRAGELPTTPTLADFAAG